MTPSPAESDVSASSVGNNSLSSSTPRYKIKLPFTHPNPPSINESKNHSPGDVKDGLADSPAPQIGVVASTQHNNSISVPTRRLIRKKYILPEEFDKDFDQRAWHRKLYGPYITVVSLTGVPDGWVLVDGILTYSVLNVIVDFNPPTKKIKKRWHRLDGSDPNWVQNISRAHRGMPPVDYWNIGVDYVWDGTSDIQVVIIILSRE